MAQPTSQSSDSRAATRPSVPPLNCAQPPAAPRHGQPMKVCLDVEVVDTASRDVDDTLLLILLAGDPRVELRAVTVTPGTKEQLAVVHHVLTATAGARERRVAIGAEAWPAHADSLKPGAKLAPVASRLGASLTPCEYGEIAAITRPAADVLFENCDADTTVITGGSLRNLAAALRAHAEFRCGRWIGQGGFASDSVVAGGAGAGTTQGFGEESTSYNLSKCRESFQAVAAAVERRQQIAHGGMLVSSRRHVAGNVMSPQWRRCVDAAASFDARGAAEKREFGAFLSPGRKASLQLFARCGVADGKALHDLLLLAVALHPKVCHWTPEVVLQSSVLSRRGAGGTAPVADDGSPNQRPAPTGESPELPASLPRATHVDAAARTPSSAASASGAELWSATLCPGSRLRLTHAHDGAAYLDVLFPRPEREGTGVDEAVPAPAVSKKGKRDKRK